jgi:peroxidase
LCAALAHKSIIQDVAAGGLVYNYYAKSCPRAEKIIHDMVDKLYYKKGNTAVSNVRYVFHDCFNVSFARSLLTILDVVTKISWSNLTRWSQCNFLYVLLLLLH